MCVHGSLSTAIKKAQVASWGAHDLRLWLFLLSAVSDYSETIAGNESSLRRRPDKIRWILVRSGKREGLLNPPDEVDFGDTRGKGVGSSRKRPHHVDDDNSAGRVSGALDSFNNADNHLLVLWAVDCLRDDNIKTRNRSGLL